MAPLRPKIGTRGIARRTRGAPPIPGSGLAPPPVPTLGPTLAPAGSGSGKRTYEQSQEDLPGDDDFNLPLDTHSSDNDDQTLPMSDIDPTALEAELEVLNRGDDDDLSGDDELPVDELGYDALLAARQLLEYQQQVLVQEDEVPEMGLNDDDTGVDEAITGPVGALVPIGPAPALMMPPSISSARVPGFGNDQSVVLQTKRLKDPLPSVELSLATWCQTAGISRMDYDYLRSILDMVAKDTKASPVALLQNLPNTLDTLKSHMKGSLPFVNLRSRLVKLNPLVQPTGSVKDSAELFFFDLIDFFKAYLSSSTNIDKMFHGLGHLVDAPKELYHGNAWHSSIRISSGVFAIYASGPDLRPETETETADSSKKKGKQPQKQVDDAAVQEKINRFIGSKDGPIFPSDIVNFICNKAACPCHLPDNAAIPEGRGHHFGQVQAVAMDYRSVRPPDVDEGDIVIKIREILPSRNLRISVNPAPAPNEWFMNDKRYIFVPARNVTPAKVGVLMHYAFQATYKPEDLPKGNPPRFVRRIIDEVLDDTGNIDLIASSVRPIWQDDPVRGELELNHFGRKQLISKFCRNDGIVVTSVPLCFYMDAFGLYRNMYRALMGVYLFVAALTNKERGRRANIIPLTLGPHGCNLAEVIDAVGAVIGALDAGIVIELVDGTKRMVCAQILAFLGDMPQQQLNAGFLSQKAKFGCRSCIRDTKTWNNLDIKQDEQRYYHDTMRTRIHLETYAFKTAKAKVDFAQNVGKSMKPEVRPLERIAPALDLKIGTPADAAHSELQGLAKRVHLLLKDAIFTDAAMKQYHFLLTTFPLPGNWQALQSPYHYIGSYTLQEHGRWAQIIPVLTRVWLRDEHLKPGIAEGLRIAMPAVFHTVESMTTTRPVPASAVVVVALSQIARSQRSLMGHQLTMQQHQSLEEDVLHTRRFFQGLCEAAAQASINNAESRATSRASSRASQRSQSAAPGAPPPSKRARGAGRGRGTGRGRGASASTVASRGSSTQNIDMPMMELDPDVRDPDRSAFDDDDELIAMDDDDDHERGRSKERITKDSQLYRRLQKLPNVHTGMHYAVVVREYAQPSNVNTLHGEDLHR